MDDPLQSFIAGACAPRDRRHVSGTLEDAEAILATHSDIAGSIHAAAILGDDATVRRFLALDASSAPAKGGPYGWDGRTIWLAYFAAEESEPVDEALPPATAEGTSHHR